MNPHPVIIDIAVPFSETTLALSCTTCQNPYYATPKWKVGLAGILEPSINFLIDTEKFRQLTKKTPKLVNRNIPSPPQPFTAKSIRSSGNTKDSWVLSFLPPFHEIEHIADIAFTVKGESLPELHYHAFIALSFYEPQLLKHHHRLLTVDSLDEIIKNLNTIVSIVDAKQGCAFKAVSYHGEIKEDKGTLSWEMIVDV